MDNSIAEIKSNVEAMNSKLNDTGEQTNDLEDRIMGITKSEQQTEREIKKRKQHTKSMG